MNDEEKIDIINELIQSLTVGIYDIENRLIDKDYIIDKIFYNEETNEAYIEPREIERVVR